MRVISTGLCLLFAIFLSACVESPPPFSRTPDMTFDHFKKVELNVSKIEVRNDYKPPMAEPNVEHFFRPPPYIAAENLVKRQLVTFGTKNILRIIIVDASVVRKALEVSDGFRGLIWKEPSEQLDANVLLRFELVDENAPDIVIGNAEISAKRTKTLLEGISVADREAATFRLTEELMSDLNTGLQTIVRQTFGIAP